MRPLWSLLALLTLAACGSATHPTPGAGVQPSGTAGSSAGTTATPDPSGAAGSASAAGTTGAAGSTSPAGSAGTTAGTSAATAGTTAAPSDDASAPPDALPDASTANPDAPGTPLPPYTGGIVNAINNTNWNETTIHPFTARRMLVRDECDPHLVLLDFSRPDPLVWKMVTDGPWARSLQLIGNNQVLGGRHDGYEVFDLATGQVVKTVSGHVNTQSAYRMANGETLLTRNGTTLDFLDKSDKVAHSISYPGFSFVRMARPTRNGTFLVPSDAKLFEGDDKGNVLWTATNTQWGHDFEALLMSDGNTLLATGFGSSLDVVDKTTHLVVKRFGTKQMPDAVKFKPNYFAEFQILPNGNLITSNWVGGHGCGLNSAVQIIEFTPAGEVVWFYQQDPKVLSSVQGLLVLDGMDPQFLHVQEISADSTWQPVIPTP